MSCGYVKHTFYNNHVASMTTSSMVKIYNEEAKREVLCNEVKYAEGYSIYVTLDPIYIEEEILYPSEPLEPSSEPLEPSSEPLEPSSETLENLSGENVVCAYTSTGVIEGVPQISNDVFDTFSPLGGLQIMNEEDYYHGRLEIGGKKIDVSIKLSQKNYSDFSEEVKLHRYVSEAGLSIKILGYRTCVKSEDYEGRHLLITEAPNKGVYTTLSSKKDIRQFYVELMSFVISIRFKVNVALRNATINNIVSDNTGKYYIVNLSKAVRYTKDTFEEAIVKWANGDTSFEVGAVLDDLAIDASSFTRSVMEYISRYNEDAFGIMFSPITENSLDSYGGWIDVNVNYYKKFNKIMDYDETMNFLKHVMFAKDALMNTILGIYDCPYQSYGEDAKQQLSKEDILQIDLDKTPSPYGITGVTKMGKRIIAKEFKTSELSGAINMQTKAWSQGLSTEVLAYWKCPKGGVIIMEEPSGVYYKNFSRNEPFDNYVESLKSIVLLNWEHGIIVNDFIHLYISNNRPASILGFSERSHTIDFNDVLETYNTNDTLLDSIFADITNMTVSFNKSNYNSEYFRTLVKDTGMYFLIPDGLANIHNSLYLKNGVLPSADLFFETLLRFIKSKVTLLHKLPVITPMVKLVTVEEKMSELCKQDSEHDMGCPVDIVPLTAEELKLVRIGPEVLASGANGTAYRGKYKNGSIIVKYIGDQGLGNTLSNEICNQIKASTYGVSPSILSYWKCEGNSAAVIIMDYVNGKTFGECMETEVAIVDIFLRALATLMYLNLHADIFHRDSHVENILVTQYDTFLIDYGWSRTTNPRDFATILKRVKLIDEKGNVGDNIKELTDCQLLVQEVVFRIDLVKYDAYSFYNAIKYNSLETSSKWIELHNFLYNKLGRRPYWNELYEIVQPCFRHLSILRENVILTFNPQDLTVKPLNGQPYNIIKPAMMSKIKYTRLEKTLYCDYYYGSINGANIIVAISEDEKQFVSHQMLIRHKIAPEILSYFAYGNINILIYSNEAKTLDSYDIANMNEKELYALYLVVLYPFLKLNLELSMIHYLATIGVVSILNGHAIITRFSKTRAYPRAGFIDEAKKEPGSQPVYFQDLESIANDFIILCKMYKSPHLQAIEATIKAKKPFQGNLNHQTVVNGNFPGADKMIEVLSI